MLSGSIAVILSLVNFTTRTEVRQEFLKKAHHYILPVPGVKHDASFYEESWRINRKRLGQNNLFHPSLLSMESLLSL